MSALNCMYLGKEPRLPSSGTSFLSLQSSLHRRYHQRWHYLDIWHQELFTAMRECKPSQQTKATPHLPPNWSEEVSEIKLHLRRLPEQLAIVDLEIAKLWPAGLDPMKSDQYISIDHYPESCQAYNVVKSVNSTHNPKEAIETTNIMNCILLTSLGIFHWQHEM